MKSVWNVNVLGAVENCVENFIICLFLMEIVFKLFVSLFMKMPNFSMFMYSFS